LNIVREAPRKASKAEGNAPGKPAEKQKVETLPETKEADASEEGEGEGEGEQIIFPARAKNETKEQKKERKEALKQLKKDRRERKQQFKEEFGVIYDGSAVLLTFLTCRKRISRS
jgi:hypothetical protein